jgi:enoyl-CoA hydratase
MSDPLVHLERRDDGVAVLTLANGKMNALSVALLEQLTSAARSLVDDPPGAVVLTGGSRLFAAGADVSEFGGVDQARIIGAAFVAATGALAAIERVTIASISGYALGGGCELALACDLRIASDRARLGQPEILLGIIPGGGGTQRLARLVGPARAKDLILTGRQVDAGEALALGLVDEVVSASDLDAHVDARAAAFAAGPLLAHAAAKRAIDRGLQVDLAAGVAIEQDEFARIFATADAAAGVQSFLADGPGKATFSGT